MLKKLKGKMKTWTKAVEGFWRRLPRRTLFIGSYLLVLLLLFAAFYWRTAHKASYELPSSEKEQEQVEKAPLSPSLSEEPAFFVKPAEESGAEERALGENVAEGQPLPDTAPGEMADSHEEEGVLAEELEETDAAPILSSPPADPLPRWQLVRPFSSHTVQELPTGYRVHSFTRGVDLAGADSAPVAALWEGTVQKIMEKDALLGKWVLLSHEGGGTSFYGNLGEIWVQAGQLVTRGEHLGKLYPALEKGGDSFLYLEVTQDGQCIDPLDLLEGVARH